MLPERFICEVNLRTDSSRDCSVTVITLQSTFLLYSSSFYLTFTSSVPFFLDTSLWSRKMFVLSILKTFSLAMMYFFQPFKIYLFLKLILIMCVCFGVCCECACLKKPVALDPLELDGCQWLDVSVGNLTHSSIGEGCALKC